MGSDKSGNYKLKPAEWRRIVQMVTRKKNRRKVLEVAFEYKISPQNIYQRLKNLEKKESKILLTSESNGANL